MITLLPKNGVTIEMLDWWLRFSLDSSTDYLFGESVESLTNPKVSEQDSFTSSNSRWHLQEHSRISRNSRH